MTGWHNKQEERILNLEHQLSQVNNAFLESFMNLQEDFRRLDDMVSRHKAIIKNPRGRGSSLRKVNSVLAKVDRKMEEFQDWVNYVKPTDITTEIPMEIVNTLNDIIMDRSPAASMEYVRERVEHLEGAI